MLEDIISYISTLDPSLIYLALFFFGFIENIVPPLPSDFVVVLGATLVANSTLSFLPILLITSVGSGLGFIVMYFIGKNLGDKLIRTGKIKFIKAEYLEKADLWFHKYGYNLILINRFLPGTRAVISFFSGFHRLKKLRTFIYAIVSSFLWNTLLIILGIFLGNNIDLIDKYLTTYSDIALLITLAVVAYFVIRYFFKRKKKG
ncbi:DedA family protein [Rosettibacter firmus]|uniref:DedA family protein n=1 Tax=Rosettibacter firmus TaxID=3111522 RepID=UPI00336BDBF0